MPISAKIDQKMPIVKTQIKPFKEKTVYRQDKNPFKQEISPHTKKTISNNPQNIPWFGLFRSVDDSFVCWDDSFLRPGSTLR